MNGYSCLFLKYCGFLRQAQRMALCTVWMLALISRCLLWRLTRKRCQVSWACIVFVPSAKAYLEDVFNWYDWGGIESFLNKNKKKRLCVVIMCSWTVKQSVLRSHCKRRTLKMVNFSQQILWRINMSKQVCSFGTQSLCFLGEEGQKLWTLVQDYEL